MTFPSDSTMPLDDLPVSDAATRLQHEFRRFAKIGCHEDPLYAAISEAVAEHAGWASLLDAAPVPLRVPTLWFAALHDRLLGLHEAGAPAPALAAYYASLGGTRAPDAALPEALGAFLERERPALRERIATSITQTNEIGRSVVLWPVLAELARRTGRSRLALLDVGSSAGLNLGVDRWRYRYVDELSGATLHDEHPAGPDAGAGPAPIVCRVLAGAGRPFAASGAGRPHIASRLGIDPTPVGVDDPAAVRWLRACLWPHDAARRERLEAAVAVARAARWPVRRVAAEDTLKAIGDWLAALPADVLPVVFNSWVLFYFDEPALRDHVDRLLQWVARRGVAWVSAESRQHSRLWWPAMPAPQALHPGSGVAPDDLVEATAWTVATRSEAGGVDWWLPARSHAHGRWMQWSA
jgi:hypothetical protein